jgi:putative ABC transport system permease protein
MEIRPIISALLRSKVSLVLIGLQIALTLAIVCNALFIINQRFATMGRPSGMNEADTFVVSSYGFGAHFDTKSSTLADLSMLRGLPGVEAVTSEVSVPLGGSGWSEGLSLTPDQKTPTAGTAIYFVDEHGIDSFGLTLVAGRNFKAEEITVREPRSTQWPSGVIITRALAKKMFGDDNAVGRQFYLDVKAAPITVLGVVDRLQTPWPHNISRSGDQDIVEYSMLVPQYVSFGNQVGYLVRTEPGRRDEVMKLVEAKLVESNRGRIIEDMRSLAEIRQSAYAEDRAMTLILGGVIVALLSITALGIVGMASFWVGQRTKQIGTRRALGATKFDILRYFLTENFLMTTIGLALGVVLTYALNLWLMSHYHSPLLPWFYVPTGVICLWLLGQLAVLGPAKRASRVPPAIATRSV